MSAPARWAVLGGLGIVLVLGWFAGAAVAQRKSDTEVCFERTGNPELDVHYCSLALDARAGTDIDRATLLIVRGEALTAIRRFKPALRDFEEALALNPSSAVAHDRRGLARHAMGDYEAAVEDFTAAIELYPLFFDSYRNRGTAYLYLNRIEAAREAYDTVLAQRRRDPALFVLRGMTRYLLGAYKAAGQDFAEAAAYPYPYLPLWRYLASERAGRDGRAELAEALLELEVNEWPAPLFEHYLNGGAVAPVLAAATAATPAFAVRRQAEAYFFLGQRALLAGDAVRARQYFLESGPPGQSHTIEAALARAMLAR